MRLPQIWAFPALSAVPREVVRPVLIVILAGVLWLWGWTVWSGTSGMESSIALQQRRLDQLVEVIGQYRAISGGEGKPVLTEDPIVVVSSLVGTMGLKENLVQISSMNKGLNVQLGRMYMDKALDFLLELDKRGLAVESAEIRAVPDGGSRLLSLTLVVVVAS